MEKMSKSYVCTYMVIGFISVMLNSCASECCKDGQFAIGINNIGFECRLPQKSGDTLRLTPIVMYIDMDVINNTDKKLFLGAYNRRFDQSNKKYGRFELIYDRDTIGLYTDYPDQYEFEPGESIQMQLHYENIQLLEYDKFLDRMSVAWIGTEPKAENIIKEKLKEVQHIAETLKIGYTPFDDGRLRSADFRTQTSPEISVDYVYSDGKVFTMHKNDSGWNCVFPADPD